MSYYGYYSVLKHTYSPDFVEDIKQYQKGHFIQYLISSLHFFLEVLNQIE